MQKRLDYIDNARAMGIALVVAGHVMPYQGNMATDLIFGFHIPLFFFLSGFLLSTKRLHLSFTAFTRLMFMRLMVPYYVFAAVLYIPWVLVFRHYGASAAIPWYKPFIGIFYGVGADGWLQQSTPLWFLPALFLAKLAIYGIMRQPARQRLPLAALVAVAGLWTTLSPIILPFSASCAMLAVPFMVTGIMLRQGAFPAIRLSRSWWVKIGLWIFGLALYVGLVLLNGAVDINNLHFGTMGPTGYYLVAFVGIMVFMRMAKAAPPSRITRYVSISTLWILALHIPVFTLIKGLGKAAGIAPEAWGTTPTLIILLTLLGIAFPVAIRTAILWVWPRIRPVLRLT